MKGLKTPWRPHKVPTIKPSMPPIMDGDEVCRYVRETHGPRALLAFSRGKDSIAAWLKMREYFEDIVPLFWYLVPDLEFELESLDYFERYFGTKIHRLPHPSLNRLLNNFVFQPPERVAIIEAADLPEFSYEDCWTDLCEELGIERIPNGTGVRATDSPMRRMGYQKHGLYRAKAQTFMPIGDWNKRRTMEAIERAGIEMPDDYRMFKRSFDGIDYRFASQLKAHRPRDFQRILDWFPLLELDLFRYEQMGFKP